MLKNFKVILFTLLAFSIFMPSSFCMHVFHHKHHHDNLPHNSINQTKEYDTPHMCCNHNSTPLCHSCDTDKCEINAKNSYKTTTESNKLSFKRIDIELIAFIDSLITLSHHSQEEFYIPIFYSPSAISSIYINTIQNTSVLIL